MLVHQVAQTSAAVAATRSRKEKVAAIALALSEAGADLAMVTSWLAGSLRQRRTGVGYRGLQDLPEPADTATLTVAETDAVFESLGGFSGAGSQAARAAAVAELFGRATALEQRWLRGLITGEVRQGALDALVIEAVAAATGVGVTKVRRAAMLAGGPTPAALAAFSGGEQELADIQLKVGRPVLPMLASSASDLAAAMAKAGVADAPVAVDTKLDGIRIQVHRDGDEVLITTRSLDDITHRLPEVVDLARSLPSESFVLDGEALALDESGRPRPFQETASRTAQSSGVAVTAYFFDLLSLNGHDLLDEPGSERLAALENLVPTEALVPRLVTADHDEAQEFVTRALAAGHEGVVVKNLQAPYAAGRRGAGWVKVKPVHTLDLVVLAIEWGSGRRQGWLSNIHLGARDDTSPTGFVMLGKTFKGMTDEILTWQTERFLALETERDGHIVHVRPEQVVEIAIDGVQRSIRYPGGVALRFARVLRYRDDKRADEADTIGTVQSLL